MCNIAEETVN